MPCLGDPRRSTSELVGTGESGLEGVRDWRAFGTGLATVLIFTASLALALLIVAVAAA
jgi:hypothetical protein